MGGEADRDGQVASGSQGLRLNAKAQEWLPAGGLSRQLRDSRERLEEEAEAVEVGAQCPTRVCTGERGGHSKGETMNEIGTRRGGAGQARSGVADERTDVAASEAGPKGLSVKMGAAGSRRVARARQGDGNVDDVDDVDDDDGFVSDEESDEEHRGDDADAIEDVLLFDVHINESALRNPRPRSAVSAVGACSRGHSARSAHSGLSSPRAAAMTGPSPLPSPAASPIPLYGSLMKQTEQLSMALEVARERVEGASAEEVAARLRGLGDAIHAAEKHAAAEEEEDVADLEVVTHVETEAGEQLKAKEAKEAKTGGGNTRKLCPEDFELLRVVGQGAFGKVFQVRKKDTGEVFAMKVMKKDRVLEKDHGEYVRAERNALTAVVHPYIVTLRYSFQTSKKLYLVLDFINGGHLFFQLYRAGVFEEELARLYTAELVSAITHLHALGFVHRDLKPENVLLDSHGHVKVTDFGLAKGNMSDAEHHRTNSFIGTMEYMAPEIIQGRGHGKAVDWWSTGILLYEMLCGMPPFRAKSKNALQKLIVSGKLKLPTYLSSEAQSLLKGLLTKDASKRLGYGEGGSEAVKKHAFFKGIDWVKLEDRELVSPFRPKLEHHMSVENFDKIWTDLPAQDSPCTTPTTGSLGENNEFDGFSYVAPSLLAQLSSPPLGKK